MKRFFPVYLTLLVISLFFAAVSYTSPQNVLVFTSAGQYVTKTTLANAIVSPDCAGKTIVITQALTAGFSNISSATVHTWPTDRALRIEPGGSLANTTVIRFTGASVSFPRNIPIFLGTGRILGLNLAWPEMFAQNVIPGTTDMTVATQKALDTRSPVDLLGTYNWTSTLYCYDGTHVVGHNCRPGWTDSPTYNPTVAYFKPVSPMKLFDTYTRVTQTYMYRVYISGIDVYGNGTNSQYGIFARTGRSIYENLLFSNFQVGIHTEYTMLDNYNNISLMNMLVNGLETGDSFNTSATFTNVYFGYSPWGATLKNALGYQFIGCKWESMTTGGVNAYRGFGSATFTSYGEDIPNTVSGNSYAMFYVGHAGPDVSQGTNIQIIGGTYQGSDNGDLLGAHGSFIDAQYMSTTSGAADRISVMGVKYGGFTNGIKVDSTFTDGNSIFVAGNATYSLSSPFTGDTSPTSRGYRIYGILDTASSAASSSALQANTANVGSLTMNDVANGSATQKAISKSFPNGTSYEYDFTAGKPALIQVTATDGVSTQESGVFSVAYITGTNNCTVKQLSGTSNMSITNTASKLCVYPGATGAGTVFILKNMAVTLQVTATVIN